jgi:hypothetical protein
VLLGQRLTPASLSDERAFPPPRDRLLASAAHPHSAADHLSVAARALTKHVGRIGGTGDFWGQVTGTIDQKNSAALAIVERILDQTTWWNVFGHCKHEHVFEARVSSGHGARWAHTGDELIGFVEPFEPADNPDVQT